MMTSSPIVGRFCCGGDHGGSGQQLAAKATGNKSVEGCMTAWKGAAKVGGGSGGGNGNTAMIA